MSSYLTCNREFLNNSKKFQKIKKTPFWLLFKLKQVGKGQEREKIKKTKQKIVPMSSYPTYNREFQKNNKKFQKIKKTPLWLLFKPKQVGNDREREEIKKIVPLSSYKTRNRKLKKNQKN